MAAQIKPTYMLATGKPEEPIVREIVSKYGYSNISWTIILSESNKSIAYIYEKNEKNDINSEHDIRPHSKLNLPSYFLDYLCEPRLIKPYTSLLSEFIEPEYTCSYDYIVESPYITVDLDYVWYTGSHFKGFELTTFFMNFDSHKRAKDLISKMHKRPSWQGKNGAHALKKIVESALDLNIDYYLVCVNTVSKVGSDIKTEGNVCIFPLNHTQINRLEQGLHPIDSIFLSFEKFLEWL